MKRFFKFYIATLFVFIGSVAYGQDFFSTEPASNLFDIGVRLGVNSSVRTASDNIYDVWNTDSWGTGLVVGAVADLNLRDFFTLQPGVFFECRSGNYSYAQSYLPGITGTGNEFTQMGHYRNYHLNIPVLFSFRFNLAPKVRWAIEGGPYGQLNLKSSDKDKIRYMVMEGPDHGALCTAKIRRFDVGVKIGSGISYRQWSFNVHYLMGFRRTWSAEELGGHNKAWTFTLGYIL